MTIEETAGWLQAHDRFLILTHVRPDGDTVGCAAALCGAAMESAALNVKINTKSMKNRAVADNINAEMNELLQKYFVLSQEIYNDVSGRLS